MEEDIKKKINQVDDYLYKWSDKKVIATHVYSRYQKDAREKAKRFMQEIDEEV